MKTVISAHTKPTHLPVPRTTRPPLAPRQIPHRPICSGWPTIRESLNHLLIINTHNRASPRHRYALIHLIVHFPTPVGAPTCSPRHRVPTRPRLECFHHPRQPSCPRCHHLTSHISQFPSPAPLHSRFPRFAPPIPPPPLISLTSNIQSQRKPSLTRPSNANMTPSSAPSPANARAVRPWTKSPKSATPRSTHCPRKRFDCRVWLTA